MRVKTLPVCIAVFIIAAYAIPEIAQACPNCKESYMADGGASVASGFSASVLFMMAMPFLVIGGFVLRLWTAQRKVRQTESRS